MTRTMTLPSRQLETRLTKLLCEDVEGGVGIKEAVTNDLADDLVGANIVAFGTWLGGQGVLGYHVHERV